MAGPKKKQRAEDKPAEIPMTPMIDVVFQLLIYFIYTMKPLDIISHLDVFRPSPEAQRQQSDVPPNLLKIAIYADGFTINEKAVSYESLEAVMTKLAALNKDQTVLIMCTALSPHFKLVQVLDLCQKLQLNNLSVISTN